MKRLFNILAKKTTSLHKKWLTHIAEVRKAQDEWNANAEAYVQKHGLEAFDKAMKQSSSKETKCKISFESRTSSKTPQPK